MKYPTELLEKLSFHAIHLDYGCVSDVLGELADFVGAELCRHDVAELGLDALDGPVVFAEDPSEMQAYRDRVESGIRGAVRNDSAFRHIVEVEYTTGRIVGAYERELERQEDLRCDPKGI